MKPFVRLEIDEMPLGLWRLGALDYMGRYVGAAAVEPLFRFDDIEHVSVPGILTERAVELDGLRHRFRVRSDLRWSNGHPVSAQQLAEHLLDVQARHPYWAHHLRHFAGVRGNGDILVVELSRPVRHLTALLCADELAPVCRDPWGSQAIALGPYRFAGLDPDRSSLRFAPNPFFPEAAERPPLLEFMLERDVRTVPERFRRKSVDITCSTMFPLASLAEWSGRPEFRSGPAPIWMQVEFGAKSHPAFLRRDIRFALSIAVEREALSNLLNGGAAPRRSTLGMTRRFGSRHAVGIAAERCEGLSAIRLAYCDYYPNLRVAEFLRDTWAEALDLSIELVRVPFGAISAAEADLRLELRYLTFPDPIAELESAMAMLARVGSPEERKRAKDLAVQLHYGPENSADSCLAELVHLLDDSVAVIPLLDLSHHCLISSRVSGFNLPHLGNLDYRSLRLETD